MAILSVHRLSKYFGERCLFDKLSFEVGEHDRIGLVGSNGSGKTTLFRMLIGDETVDSGDVLLSKHVKLGYLEQHTLQDEDITVWEAVERVFEPLRKLEAELADINERLSTVTEAPAEWLERQHQLQETFEAEGGLYYKSRVSSTLTGLGFTAEQFTQPVSTLSGGQRSKIAMGCLLLSKADLLLLDEPTNHLDIPSVEWLEGFLRSYTGAAIIISHDRYFLDRVTNRTIEITQGSVYMTNGNYTAHKEKRERDREIALHHHKTMERRIKKLEDNIALLKRWNREKSVRAAESREKRLDRLKEQQVQVEQTEHTVHFGFTASTVSGNDVLDAENLAMQFAKPLFRDVSFQLHRGERVVLIGPNGCGKTTLLRLITGELTPQQGSLRLGAKVSIGYYDQIQSRLSYDKTAIDQLWDDYPQLTQTEIRNALATFLFYGDEVFKPISALSGGERARLLLLRLMLAHDNLLLLDEPTNHLDIASREALEEALEGYDGTLLIVSHDRYFINRMATRVLHMTPNGCESIVGNYDTFAERSANNLETATQSTEKPAKENAYKARKELESQKRKLTTKITRCEEEIHICEQAIADTEQELEKPENAADYETVTRLSADLEALNRQLEDLFAAWEEAQLTLETLTSSS
ncbi:MAG: ABC-F family ATP-binding cassette domain-containing protein [Clostridia bacterium]|nr:ABC-F family ATP-binding cassette domain-containing protein [Clostridia bacterium]